MSKDILTLAREAGFMVVHEGDAETGAWYECFTDEIERFAELVRADSLDWLAAQHRAQCGEDRPIQEWIRKMKEVLP